MKFGYLIFIEDIINKYGHYRMPLLYFIKIFFIFLVKFFGVPFLKAYCGGTNSWLGPFKFLKYYRAQIIFANSQDMVIF